MGLGYEVVDFALVVVEEGLDVFLVEEGGALGAGEDEVEVQEEAHPGVEGDPGEDEVERVLNRVEEHEGDEVDEPWGELGWIGGVEGFVGGEDGEEHCDGDAGFALAEGPSSKYIFPECLEAARVMRRANSHRYFRLLSQLIAGAG